MSKCTTPNCAKQARTSFRSSGPHSRYCEAHRWRWRTHGDAGQRAIHKGDLKPFVDSARRIIDRDETGKLKDVLSRLHAGLKDYALGVSGDIARGQQIPKWTARGAELVARVLSETDSISCACVVVSMFMLRAEQPYRFVSQRAFEFELARAFRKQVETAWGRYWDDKNGRSKTVYKEITPRCVESIAILLIYTYAKLASRIVTLYQQKRDQLMADRRTIDEVFNSLTERLDASQTTSPKSSPPAAT